MSSTTASSIQAFFSEIWLSPDLQYPIYLYVALQSLRVVLFGVEYFVSRRRGLDNFCAQELRVHLLVHAGERISGLLYHGVLAAIFIFVYKYRLLDLPQNSFWTLLWGIVVVDFAYYLTHRWFHECRLGWATHLAHHTSNKYNLSMSYRSGLSPETSLGWVPGLIVPLLGVSPTQGATCFVISRLYQYWTHTSLLPEMRWFGIIFVTPAHHRVHHSNAPEYINRNYGGILIIFDKMFGTFSYVSPSVPLQYGLHRPLPTKSFFGIVLYGWKELARDVIRKRSLLVLFERTPAIQYENSKRSRESLGVSEGAFVSEVEPST